MHFTLWLLIADVWLLHYMYIHELYPTHMWYKQVAHLHCWRFFARMLSKSKRFGDNVHAASGPGPASYTLYEAGLVHLLHARCLQEESYRFCPCFWGRSHPWFFARSQHATIRPRWNQRMQRLTPATGATSLLAMLCSPKAELALKAERTPVELKRILEKEFDQEMGTQFFKEFEILKGCQHPNVVTAFSAYEVPIPAFTNVNAGIGTSYVAGKNLGPVNHRERYWQWAFVVNIVLCGWLVLVAFNNAAAAVQDLHSVSIAHRDIKPHNFCHQLHCHSWEVKLIDSMSLTSHECDSLTLTQRRNLRSILAEFVQLQFWDRFSFFNMNMIQKGYERKDSKSKETTRTWTSIEEFWD